MPAAPTVKELCATGPQNGEQMLEIRRGGAERAERHRVGRPVTEGEEHRAGDAGTEIHRPILEIPVRHVVAGQMQRRSESERRNARADYCSGRSAGRHMHQSDHPTSRPER